MSRLYLIVPCTAALIAACPNIYPEKDNPNYRANEGPILDMALPLPDGSCHSNMACDSGLCLDTKYPGFTEAEFTCVPEEKIIYVDRESPSQKQDGTKDNKYSDLNSAIQKLQANKSYILVAATATSYDSITVRLPDDRSLAIIGPWADPALSPNKGDVYRRFWVTDTARMTELTILSGQNIVIDGFDITSSVAPAKGILCLKSAQLYIQRTKISRQKTGVEHIFDESSSANICKKIIINRARMQDNDVGLKIEVRNAKSFANIDAHVYNSLLSGNRQHALYIGGTFGINSLRVTHSTITNNGFAAPFPSVNCLRVDMNKMEFCGSLLFDNPPTATPPDMGTLIRTNCNLKNSIEGHTYAGGLPAPEFTEEGMLSYPIKGPGASNQYYIDKIPKSACLIDADIRNTDIIGTMRPQGEKADYGMHEVVPDMGGA